MPCKRKYKIKASRNGSNYSFALEDLNGGPPNLVFNKTTDKIKPRDYYELEFHLDNDSTTQSNLEFVDDRTKVFSACAEKDAVNGCAPEGSNYLPIVYLDPVKPLGKKLVHVINSDPDVEKFFFGFSFISTDGKPAYFDPGGDNQNGGLRSDWTYEIVGAISGAVAAIGAASLVSNSLEPSLSLAYGAGGAVVGLIVGLVFGRF